MKLRTITSTLRRMPTGPGKAPTLSDKRIAGTTLRNRRWKMWSVDPHCKLCGRLTDWPYGFELDHIVRLDKGGPDVEANCQVLCVHWAVDGAKLGCHAEKTAAEAKMP